MSWLDDLGSAVSGAWDWLTESKTGNNLLMLGGTALAAYTLNKVNSNVKSSPSTSSTSSASKNIKGKGGTTTTEIDTGVRLQLNASTENKVPVVYGSAWISGKLVDVRQTPNRSTMILTYVLCEKTGKLNLGKGPDSVITCQDVYWNDNKLNFLPNGFAVKSFVDNDNVVNTDVNDLISVLFYNNGSTSPAAVNSSSINPNLIAYQVMQQYGWDSTWTMDNLVFAIVFVEYNKAKNVTNVGNFKFHLQNTMKQPGDCLYDYMTSPIYGGAMDPGEVFSQ